MRLKGPFLVGAGISFLSFLKYDKNGDIPCIVDTSRIGTVLNGKSIHHRKVPLSRRAEIEVQWDTFYVFYNLVDEEDGYSDSNGPQILQGQKTKYYVFESLTLGEGAHATVKLAIDMTTGEKLACKVIEKKKFKTFKTGSTKKQTDHHESIDPTFIEREISILKKVKHPNIVQIKDVIQTTSYVCIFLDRIIGGELFDYILKKNYLPQPESKFIFFQILLALQYLHKIAHRDLKPENLLLETPNAFSRVIVTDFGLAKMLDSSFERMNTKCGTVNYIAPEVLSTTRCEGYSQAVDCWSLGVLLFVMLSGEFPFGGDEDQGLLLKRIKLGKFDFGGIVWKENEVGVVAQDLIKGLLMVDPRKRLTIDEALEHPWISGQREILDKLYFKMLGKSSWDGKFVMSDHQQCKKKL